MSDEPSAIEFTYDPETNVRTAVFRGAVDDALLLGAYDELLQEPDYLAEADDLVDLRLVTRLEVSTAALRRLMAMYRPIDALGKSTRLAIVAADDFVFGMSRMYELLRGDDVPEQIRVFRDADVAHAWLAASSQG